MAFIGRLMALQFQDPKGKVAGKLGLLESTEGRGGDQKRFRGGSSGMASERKDFRNGLRRFFE